MKEDDAMTDPTGLRPKKVPPVFWVVLACVAGGVALMWILVLRRPTQAVVHVDNSLAVEVKVLADGAEVGRVFPNHLEKFVVSGAAQHQQQERRNGKWLGYGLPAGWRM